jgi:3-hydroxy acid dehydrogenase / malonic semialdehyde reductase
MTSLRGMTVCITGASAGIGAACADAFAREGAALFLSARRKDRVDALASRLQTAYGVRVLTRTLDVREQTRVEQTFGHLPDEWKKIDILVNNAGLSRGLAKIYEGSVQDWEEMIDTNIKGLLYVTRTVLPGMVKQNSGHIINIGSIAGHQLYPNGNVYCASKFAVHALSQGMRMDLLGTNVRVSTVDPGLVETEFSVVRFRGDEKRARQVYSNTSPLHAEDIADVVLFCATRPPHVDIAEVIVMPTVQASVNHLHRTG